MEFIVEFLFELLFEGNMEISANKKLPKWIRYPLICLVTLFFVSITILLFIAGISIWNKSILASLFVVAISIFLLVGSILKLKELYWTRKRKGFDKNEKTNLGKGSIR